MNDPIKVDTRYVRMLSLIIPQTRDIGVVGIIGMARRNMRTTISFHDPVKRLPIFSMSFPDILNSFPNRPMIKSSVLSAKK